MVSQVQGWVPSSPLRASWPQARAEAGPEYVGLLPTPSCGVPGGRPPVTPAPTALGLFLRLLCNSPTSSPGEEGSWETSPAAAASQLGAGLLSLPLPSTKGQRRLRDHQPSGELLSLGCGVGLGPWGPGTGPQRCVQLGVL